MATDVFNELPISREDAKDPKKTERLKKEQQFLLKKANELAEKSALYAHYAENPEAVNKPFNFTAKDKKAFNELMPLAESQADFGSAYDSGPESWDDVDSWTQERIKTDWCDNRMRDSDFLEWVGESTREGVDTEDVIRANIDDLLENESWDNLDVGQRQVSDQIESAVKEAIKQGVKVGKDMTADDLKKINEALMDSAPDWKDGVLSERQVDTMVKLVEESLNQSEADVVNLPSEDEIAEIIEIDEDDAVDQFYEAYRRGKSWAARPVEDLLDAEVESRMEDDDYLREYAIMEWENLDGDASLEAGRDLGHIEGGGGSDDSSGDRTTYDLSERGIEDAASFVGAPEGTVVSVQGSVIDVSGPGGFSMTREIDGDEIKASYFMIGDEISGGTEIVAQMVRQARELDFKNINVQAAGQLGSSMNGYYTWPLMGYERDIDGLKQEDEIRQLFPNVETIQDLFDQPGGRDWWFVNGSTAYMDFDLSDDSRSMKVLERYLNEKRTK